MSSITPPPPPPSQQPSQGTPGPEILDSSSGTALGSGGRRGGARKGLLIGGGVLGLAVVGGGAWAAVSFLGTGAQPAEALPASTLAYASIDLDPSGGQKIEAVRTLDKFPGLKDLVGLDSGDDDLRRAIFDAIQDDAQCAGLDFDDDIDPWLGDRAAIAAVKDGEGSPQPVVVLQVKDAGAADKGLQAIQDCGSGEAGWVVDGDWAVVGESDAVAKGVVEAAAKSSLADDATYQKWTGEAGDAGIATLYAAPGVGPALLDLLDSGSLSGLEGGLGSSLLPEESTSQLADFQGFAATLRFADKTLELEAASSTPKGADGVLGSSTVADQVGDLPDDTAAVLGASLGKDWFQKALDGFATGFGDGSSDDFLAEIESATGLQLPEDVDTLTQDGIVVSVGPGIDPEELANAADPSDVPVAITLHGDADKIEGIVAKLQAAVPGGTEVLGTSADGDTVVVGPSQAYRDDVLGGGTLGDSETFTDVVPHDDSPGVFFLDVDAFDAVIASIGDDELSANLAPLHAIGASSQVDGDVTHVTVRVSTDD